MNYKLLSFLIILIVLISTSITLAADLKVHFIDVNQGDAILVQLPNQENLLIDAGNNQAGSTVKNYLNSLNINKIDYLLGTHPHADHIGGLDYIIYNFKIDNIYLPNVTHTTQSFYQVLTAIKKKNKKINTAQSGVQLLKNKRLNIKLLGPHSNNYDDLNNYSIITKVSYKNTSFLFTGDAELKSELEMINNGSNLKSDLLKVAHHGSSSSTGALFLNKVNPNFAVVSVGQDNKYNHPANKVINRLRQQQIKIYRTDQQGTIIATSNGQQITFNTKANNKQQTQLKSSSNHQIKISALNLKKEIVELTNTGEKSINLSGWQLVSVKGKQVFTFPTGTTIAANESLTVVSGHGKKPGPNRLVWTGRYIWNNNGDQAKLYNQQQKLISKY